MQLLVQGCRYIVIVIVIVTMFPCCVEGATYRSRGVYFQKFNPLLFAGLGLPRTKIRPEHNEGVV